MKKKGNRSDFIGDRDKELYSNFLQLLRTARETPLREMFRMAANMPASRFWVSEHRAAAVVSKILRGEELGKVYESRREMYEEIAERVRAKMAADPTLCVLHAVSETVWEPAPKFYLTDESARLIIYRHRRRIMALRRLRFKLRIEN